MKKNAKAIWDAVKTAHRYDSHIMPMRTVQALLDATVPFISILLTAFILNELASKSDYRVILWPVLAGVFVCFLMRLITGRFDQYLNMKSTIFANSWQDDITVKTMNLDYPQLEDPSVSALRDKVKRDQNWGSGISNTYWFFYRLMHTIFSLIYALILLRPILMHAALYRSWLSLGFLALVIVCIVGTFLYTSKVYEKHASEYMGYDWRKGPFSRYGMYDIEYFYGKDIRIYDASKLLAHYMSAPAYMKWLKSRQRRMTMVQGWDVGLIGLSDALIQGGAFILTTLIALAGRLSIGLVVQSASGLFQLAQNISGLFNAWGGFAVDTLRLQSQFEYCALPDVLYKGSLTTEKRSDNQYEIEFHDVSFKYPGSDNYALRHLNLQLTVGQRLAVVGMNGSGKTTMIKLLCRLYDPTEGVITLNGVDIKQYNYQEYMNIFSVVFQDFKLFGFSLGENVAMSTRVDKARVSACLDQAGFGERLSALQQGVDTYLYKDYDKAGVDISGGEAQKIALARALYKNAAFVVLDEPTAALDPIAEYEIYSRFDELIQDKTTVYISHRLSSCRFCHDVAVFHEGSLIQRGSHEQLLQDENGKYYELWHAQAQYYDTSVERSYYRKQRQLPIID
ncbi:MAG: ABC transporter ATP-binding protein/permease [Clostridium sp.]|jgi:ATP-binding cassette subfamily B protein|nr:ABC transporter ATP-binding protein/permease [Clostridium sp.]